MQTTYPLLLPWYAVTVMVTPKYYVQLGKTVDTTMNNAFYVFDHRCKCLYFEVHDKGDIDCTNLEDYLYVSGSTAYSLDHRVWEEDRIIPDIDQPDEDPSSVEYKLTRKLVRCPKGASKIWYHGRYILLNQGATGIGLYMATKNNRLLRLEVDASNAEKVYSYKGFFVLCHLYGRRDQVYHCYTTLHLSNGKLLKRWHMEFMGLGLVLDGRVLLSLRGDTTAMLAAIVPRC